MKERVLASRRFGGIVAGNLDRSLCILGLDQSGTVLDRVEFAVVHDEGTFTLAASRLWPGERSR